jgi:hypothetical protein
LFVDCSLSLWATLSWQCPARQKCIVLFALSLWQEWRDPGIWWRQNRAWPIGRLQVGKWDLHVDTASSASTATSSALTLPSYFLSKSQPTPHARKCVSSVKPAVNTWGWPCETGRGGLVGYVLCLFLLGELSLWWGQGWCPVLGCCLPQPRAASPCRAWPISSLFTSHWLSQREVDRNSPCTGFTEVWLVIEPWH